MDIYSIAQRVKQHTGPVVVIVDTPGLAQRLAFEAKYFLPTDYPIHEFRDWETLPYDQFSPHEDIISERLKLLYQLPRLASGVIFVALPTLMHRLAPRSFVQTHALSLSCRDKLDLTAFKQQLQKEGYRHTQEVYAHGEYSVRGSVLDIFPMGSNQPLRIDFFDDEIDSIRPFDIETQRSESKIDSITLLSAHEFPLTEEAISRFRTQWRAHFEGDPLRSPIYEQVSDGMAPAGIEYYLPLFFESTNTFFDYCPDNTLIIKSSALASQAELFYHEVAKRHEQYAHDVTRPILKPHECFLTPDEVGRLIKPFTSDIVQSSGQPLPELLLNHKSSNPLSKLETFLLTETNKVIFCAESAGRRESLQTLLSPLKLLLHHVDAWSEAEQCDATYCITIAPLTRGMILTDKQLTIITENDLLGEHVTQYRRQQSKGISSELVIKNLIELKIGDAVVHEHHGVARYQGLQCLSAGGVESEYLVLEFANKDKLYVPIHQLNLISRYAGISDSIPYSKLGTSKFSSAKKKALEQIKDTAAELLDVYAKRNAKKGFAHMAPDVNYFAFANSFPFEETPDQLRAIEQVIEDMTAPRPMDRLVCGDVGFGKTEVAMRAAYLAANSNKQVAVLVPTTLLAQQHYESFKDRFADTAFNIQQLSRFKSDKEKKQTLTGLTEGKVDIVIGTHALLSNLVDFKDLGLLIIDEEHRFGVGQKEKLKKLRNEVDILTLTATPIPRTLNMAMHGVRDLSIISTPPKRRLSIKTFVREYNNGIIREAILREILRGGQVYFLHNKVETIGRVLDSLTKLVPEAKIQIAHGQMRERELEKIMSDFYHQRFNVLLCTTIIETGIDVPTANTIIMDQADKLGLAQMHQLRGRVGRSHHQAYAYLLTPPPKVLTTDAQKRLEAIEQLEDLGAGFMLATHDLEIRGAGEILGEDQSGHIQTIGFSLYMELLERAVKALQSGETPDDSALESTPLEIDLKIPALIPGDYLPDPAQRLTLYKRIASSPDSSALHELQVEMIDRFGLFTQPIKNLFQVAEYKLKASALKLKKIEASESGVLIDLGEKPEINTPKLIDLIQKQPKIYKLKGMRYLQVSQPLDTPEVRMQQVSDLLYELTPPTKELTS